MNSCKYYDCGWCYAPDDVETSASSQSACLDPDYCPYLKSQMTKEETLECEIKEYTLEIEQKAKKIGNLKDILDRKEQELKQMKETDISTVLIEGDTATIMGVKYKRVEEPKEPQTLYDALRLPDFTVGYHFNEGQKDRICEVVEEWLSQFHPDDMSFENLSYSNAFFDALDLVRKTLR